jgi:RHS repeat-associated protein
MTYDAASHPVGGSYASDLEGRITKMPAPDGTDTLTLTWDILGRLTKVSDSNGTNTTYGYDPLDRLETITSGSGTTSLVYVGLTDALATSTSGGVTTVHANDLDGTELYEYSVTSGSSDHPTPAYLERDDHGDVTWTTDESGAPSGHAAYDPFGGLTSSSAGFPSTRWQGSWYEANSGLYYVIARWYSPPLGEFLSDDPLIHDTTDPQARDPYAYASGDPIDGSDPSGQCTWGPDVNIGCTVAYKYTPGPKSATTGQPPVTKQQPPVTKQQPPATAPTAKTLVVPWFLAADNRWAGTTMGNPPPKGTAHPKPYCGHTVGDKGCLVTSAAMVVARHAPGYPWTPREMTNYLKDKGEIESDCRMDYWLNREAARRGGVAKDSSIVRFMLLVGI